MDASYFYIRNGITLKKVAHQGLITQRVIIEREKREASLKPGQNDGHPPVRAKVIADTPEERAKDILTFNQFACYRVNPPYFPRPELVRSHQLPVLSTDVGKPRITSVIHAKPTKEEKFDPKARMKIEGRIDLLWEMNTDHKLLERERRREAATAAKGDTKNANPLDKITAQTMMELGSTQPKARPKTHRKVYSMNDIVEHPGEQVDQALSQREGEGKPARVSLKLLESSPMSTLPATTRGPSPSMMDFNSLVSLHERRLSHTPRVLVKNVKQVREKYKDFFALAKATQKPATKANRPITAYLVSPASTPFITQRV